MRVFFIAKGTPNLGETEQSAIDLLIDDNRCGSNIYGWYGGEWEILNLTYGEALSSLMFTEDFRFLAIPAEAHDEDGNPDEVEGVFLYMRSDEVLLIPQDDPHAMKLDEPFHHVPDPLLRKFLEDFRSVEDISGFRWVLERMESDLEHAGNGAFGKPTRLDRCRGALKAAYKSFALGHEVAFWSSARRFYRRA